MNCFIYCRKSTEDKSRQIQSIGDQKKIMTEIAHKRGLNILEIFTDEKSAGKPYQRPAFQEMIKRIHKGEASIILSWKIDRLSRNPVENGQLSWTLQQGIISEILVSDRSYLPQDNVLLFLLEGAMANQYLRDLSKNVKRGMQSRIDKGIFPGMAPMGYLNTGSKKEEKRIITDPHYFPIIKKLWDLLLTGHYQLADLFRIMTKEYPLYNKTKAHSGKPIGFSTFHRIFHNPFYCGIFKWNGERHLGSHEKMISQNEFDKVQMILNKETRTRERDLFFEYKGIFNCGTCNAVITAERKTKFIVSTQTQKAFDYYRCAHRRKYEKCKEKPLSSEQIEFQLELAVRKIILPIQVIDYGIERLNDSKLEESELQSSNLLNIQREIQTLKQKKALIEDNIVQERNSEIRSLMKRKYEETKIDIERANENLIMSNKLIENMNQEIIEKLEVLKKAEYIIQIGSTEQKKRFINSIGTNWKLKDKKLEYKAHFIIEAITKTKNDIRLNNRMFEPIESLYTSSTTLPDEQVSCIWYRLWELIKNLSP